METGLGQVQEKDAEINRLLKELQSQRVCNVWLLHCKNKIVVLANYLVTTVA